MRRMVAIATLILCAASAAGADVLPRSPSERIQVFATCWGRYAALADHERVTDGSASDQSVMLQHAFKDLVEATLPAAVDWGMPKRQAHSWQFEARQSTARLLQSGTTSDAVRRDIDSSAARAYLAECQGLILGT